MDSKLELKLNERVEIYQCPGLDGKQGYTLGKSSENIVDFYMIMLDIPTETHLAVNMIESCLKRI